LKEKIATIKKKRINKKKQKKEVKPAAILEGVFANF
jgi:hypothetical protein